SNLAPSARARATHSQSTTATSTDPPLRASLPASGEANSLTFRSRPALFARPWRRITSNCQAKVPVVCRPMRKASAARAGTVPTARQSVTRIRKRDIMLTAPFMREIADPVHPPKERADGRHISPAFLRTTPSDATWARSACAELLLGAALQFLFLDRKNRAGLDLNVRNDTGPPALIDKFDVVGTCLGVGDFQALVMIDGVIAIIVGLVAVPLVFARQRKLQRGDCVGGQVPESCVLCRSSGRDQRQHEN